MDVFGNSSYIPTQSVWSQTEFLPGLNSFTATNTTSTWSQTPPSNMPWKISYGQTLPSVVRFTGQPDTLFPHQSSISSFSSSVSANSQSSSKRRLDDESTYYQTEPPSKQLITEEKMAAKMNNMHISSPFQHSNISHVHNTNNNNNSYVSHNNRYDPNLAMFSDDGSNDSESNVNGCEGRNNNSKMPSLYLSEEIKNYTKSPLEPCLPKCMIPRSLNSKALVLWTPPLGTKPVINNCSNEYIKSDDPNCSVVITEIHDEPNVSGEEEMVIDM